MNDPLVYSLSKPTWAAGKDSKLNDTRYAGVIRICFRWLFVIFVSAARKTFGEYSEKKKAKHGRRAVERKGVHYSPMVFVKFRNGVFTMGLLNIVEIVAAYSAACEGFKSGDECMQSG